MKLTEQQIQEIILEETTKLINEKNSLLKESAFSRIGEFFMRSRFRPMRRFGMMLSDPKITRQMDESSEMGERWRDLKIDRFYDFVQTGVRNGKLPDELGEEMKAAFTALFKMHGDSMALRGFQGALEIEKDLVGLTRIAMMAGRKGLDPEAAEVWQRGLRAVVKSFEVAIPLLKKADPTNLDEALIKAAGRVPPGIGEALIDMANRLRYSGSSMGNVSAMSPASKLKILKDLRTPIPRSTIDELIATHRTGFYLVLASMGLAIGEVAVGLVSGPFGWALGFFFGDDEAPTARGDQQQPKSSKEDDAGDDAGKDTGGYELPDD